MVLPFLMSCVRTHLRMALLGCFDSTPTFSRTMPRALGCALHGVNFFVEHKHASVKVPIVPTEVLPFLC